MHSIESGLTVHISSWSPLKKKHINKIKGKGKERKQQCSDKGINRPSWSHNEHLSAATSESTDGQRAGCQETKEGNDIQHQVLPQTFQIMFP